MMEASTDTFLGLEAELCTYDRAKVVLLPVPYDGTTCYRPGTRFGPRAIVEASSHVELLDPELGVEPWEVGLHLLPELEPSTAGPEAVVEQVEQACSQPIGDGKHPFVLGGEHSITVGVGRAVAREHPGISVLQVDAHLDLRDSYQGSPFSHACVARRLLDLGLRVVHVGVRTACPEELAIIRERNLDPLWAHELQGQRSAAWIQRAVDQLAPNVYVSVDVDGLDPSVMPGTGTPVPGGLGWYQLLELLRVVGRERRVVGCDLVELAPIPGQNVSEFTAAQLAYKMVGYFWPK